MTHHLSDRQEPPYSRNRPLMMTAARAAGKLELESASQIAFQPILDQLPVFVYLLTRDYTLHYVNSCFRSEFGVPDQFTRCYSIMRKSHSPCEKCPAMEVFGDRQERVWQWSDTLRGNTYEVHDIPYGDQKSPDFVLGVGINLGQRVAHLPPSSQENFVTICSYCRKIRNDKGRWQCLEGYFGEQHNLLFSHGICPHCLQVHYPELHIETPCSPPADKSGKNTTGKRERLD